MRTLLATVLLFIAAPSVAGATCYDWPLRTSQGRMAYDGDTIYITLPRLPPSRSAMLVRVAGVDTPALRGNCETETARARQA